MSNYARRLRAVAATVCLAAGMGLAQGAAAPQQLDYVITVGGVAAGEAGMALTKGPDGASSSGYARVTGLLDFSDALETRPDGAATSYHLSGTTRGAPVTIDVTFGPDAAAVAIVQGGATHNVSVPLPGPVYVLDNNFIDGFQIVADQALKAGAALTLDIFVPQAVALGTFKVGLPRPGTVTLGGVEVQARRLDGVMQVGPQTIDVAAYLDDDGNIIVLTSEPGGVRFERGTGAPEARTRVPAALAAAQSCLTERDLSISSTGATLVGKLTLPVAADEGGAPTLLLLPGSGAVDLDGNSPPLLTNDGYKQLAYALACRGYGVLRSSKLGVPPSSGDGNAVTLDTYAQNAADWLAKLAAEPGVDSGRLGLIGHSEGGLVALYATANGYTAPRALVLIASAGRPFEAIIREQLLASAVRSGASAEQQAELGKQVDEMVAAVTASTGTALTLTPQLLANPVAGMFANAAGLLRSEFGVEPPELAREVSVPVAVLQGEKDVQVRVVDAELIAAAAPRATLLLFKDLTHNLVDTSGPAEGLLLPGADAVISPTLVQVVATYLAGNMRRGR